MSKRDNDLLLEDMLEAAIKIKKYCSGLDYNDFISDDKTIDAVIRNFEVIGEASNRINPDFKILNPEIEWSKLNGFRNRLIHEYFGVDHEIVWEVIQEDIKPLIDFLSGLLN
jgi:uncharacterized protein with HEPN domain